MLKEQRIKRRLGLDITTGSSSINENNNLDKIKYSKINEIKSEKERCLDIIENEKKIQKTVLLVLHQILKQKIIII